MDPTGMNPQDDRRYDVFDWLRNLFTIEIEGKTSEGVKESIARQEEKRETIGQIADGLNTLTDILSIVNPVGSIAKTAAKVNAGVEISGEDIAFSVMEVVPAAGVVKTGAKAGKVAVKTAKTILNASDALRIENAATRIGKPINVVGSRASGTAGALSDWDYVIEGINSRSWSKIKNSLPGSKSIIENTPKNIDIIKTPLDKTKPHITIYPKK